MRKNLILLAFGDHKGRKALYHALIQEDLSVHEASDGISALKLVRRNEYQLIVLDDDLPELDGYLVCGQIRLLSQAPVVFLGKSRRREFIEQAYHAGADDYIQKPFLEWEILLRVRAWLRRTSSVLPETRITIEGLAIFPEAHTVLVDDADVSLSPKEFQLLLLLSRNPNRVFTREMLLSNIWGEGFFGSDRTVDTHIKTLRDHIKPYGRLIETVWGIGYKLQLP